MPRPPIIAGTIVRFSMIHTCATGRPADCVMDISLDETGESRATAVTDLVPLVLGVWQDNMMACMWNGITFTGARYLDLDSLSGTGGFHGPVSGKPTTGSQVDQAASPNTAYLIHKICSHTRAQTNGRMYVPGCTEGGVNNDGGVVSAQLSTLNTKTGAMLSAINGATLLVGATTAWRVVHVTGHTGTPVPGYPNGYPNTWNSTDINSVNADGKVATQRRRLRK